MVDFKPNLPELFSISDVESVCRICLCPNNILYSIFENKIDILISAFTLNKPYRNDGYPNQICSKCYIEVKSAFCFMKQCRSAHNFVKLFLNMPLSKKTILCNLCTTNFYSNSNLKRHLKNIHYIEWEIGTPRPDESNNFKNPINVRKDSNLRSECGSYVEPFETDLNYKENVCATNYENNLHFVNSTDKKRKFNFEDSSQNNYVKRQKSDNFSSNTLENANFRNLYDPHSTHDISSNKNHYLIPLIKTTNFKDLITGSIKDEKTKMLSYLNLMPKEKFEEYDNLIKLKKDERRRAYKILMKFSINKSKSLFLKRKNVGRIKDDKFQCSECNKPFKNINSKKRHELSHSKDPKPFACAICSMEFSRIEHLRLHVQNDHKNSIIKSPYQCVICQTLHIQIADLMNHFQLCGVEKTICTDNAFLTSPYKEEKQNKSKDFSISPLHNINFKERSDQRSINDNINNTNDESASNSDQCEIFFDPMNYCDANFTDDIKYEQANSYYKSNSNDANSDLLHFEKNIDFLKSLIEVEGTLDSDLMLKKMEDNERNSCGNFECEICKKQFNRKAHLQRHYLTHTTSKLFACEFCYTKFSCPEYVLTHMNRVHIDKVSQIVDNHAKMQSYELVKINNDKVNEFSKSNSQFIVRIKPAKNFPKNDVLKTKDGKFECKTCHKIFSRADHVRRHELIHSKVPKRFICDFCSRVFSRADNLKKHLDFYCVYKKNLLMSSNLF